MREKIKSLDMIRALCTVGIVLFHYSFNYVEFGIGGSHLFFARFTNGNWGGMMVAMFFMLSGAVLQYNYGEKFKLGRFYLRRWLSIFPMFYLAWFIAYLDKVNELGSWFWAGSKRLFIWTLLGIDGYFLNPGVNINYYTLGEWFLGAIVMLYLLYPALRFLFIRHERTGILLRIVFTVALTALFTMNLYRDWSSMSDGKHMLTCVMGFWIGMLLMELYQKKLRGMDERRRIVLSIVCAIAALIVMFAPLGEMKEVMVSHICGTLWFIVLMHIGEHLMKPGAVDVICSCISRWSFGIFLVHHVLLYAVMESFEGGSIDFLPSLGLFIALLLLICAVGALLSAWGALVNKCVSKVK